MMDNVGLDTVEHIEEHYIKERHLDRWHLDWLHQNYIVRIQITMNIAPRPSYLLSTLLVAVRFPAS